MSIWYANNGGSRVVLVQEDRQIHQSRLKDSRDFTMHRFDIEKDTRIVIQSKEDDFGVLCLQVRSESKHLVHSDGRHSA